MNILTLPTGLFLQHAGADSFEEPRRQSTYESTATWQHKRADRVGESRHMSTTISTARCVLKTSE